MVAFRATDTEITGTLRAAGGISGSHHFLINGTTSFIAAGANITVTTASNGQLTIASTAAGGGSGDSAAAYLVLSPTASLSNERVVTGTNGIVTTDGGAGGAFTMQLDGTVARVSGSAFTGLVSTSGSLRAAGGITGSHHFLIDGTTSLVAAGTGIAVTTASNGQITVTNTAGASFVTGSDILVTNFIQQGAAGTQAQSGSIRWPHKSGLRGRNHLGTDREILTYGVIADSATELGHSSHITSVIGNFVAVTGLVGVTGSMEVNSGITTVEVLSGTNQMLSQFLQIGASSNVPQTGSIRLANQGAIIWAQNATQATGPSITTLTNNTMQIAAASGITLANAVTFGSSVSGATSFQSTGAITSLTSGHSVTHGSASILFSATAIVGDVTKTKTTTAGAVGRTLSIVGQYAVGTGTTKGGDVIINAGTGSSPGGIKMRLGGVEALELSPSGTNGLHQVKLVQHMSATSAGAGGATLPATPEGFLTMTLNGNIIKLPFYLNA